MKYEVLSPVGNFDMLYAAVNNGCDAVYLGGKNFGARSYANNFDNEELLEVVKYCHLRGVLVYVTVNTLIYNDEVLDFIKYVEYLHQIKVDALIMQDLGMIKLVREILPDMEIHASTQCHTHNIEGIKFLKELGVKRIVPARECNIEMIKEMSKICDIEVFVYGALCVSYSGCCLFSSLNGGRSGNRGQCVGNCRMSYKLDDDEGYFLSMKDLNVIDKLDEVLDSNVVSLKIEGRMKSALYVGYVTRIFRRLVDGYKSGKKYVLSNEEKDNLKKLFYRENTYGYLFNDNDLINRKFPNHQGLKIGKVIEWNRKFIKVKLNKDLNQGDGIRFVNTNKGLMVNYLYNEKKNLISGAKGGSVVYLDNKIDLSEMDEVALTLDSHLRFDVLPRKVLVKMNFVAHKDELIYLEVSDGVNKVGLYGCKVVGSINRPISYENVLNQLKKTGNTVFECLKIKIDMDEDIFISLKEINELRRRVLDELENLRIGLPNEVVNYQIPKINEANGKKLEIAVRVRNEEQLEVCLNKVDRIYVSRSDLYNKYKNYKKVYYIIPRNTQCYDDWKCLVSENGGFLKYNNYYADYTVNAVNDYTIKLLKDKGALRVCISPEVGIERLKDICDKDNEILIYGKVELMAIEKNILGKEKGILKDKDGRCFNFYYEDYLHIMDHKNIDLRDNLKELNDFACFRLDFYDEDRNEILNIIESVSNYDK